NPLRPPRPRAAQILSLPCAAESSRIHSFTPANCGQPMKAPTPSCYTTAMPDTSSHDATRRDDIHTITVKELEARIIQAGILMSHRQILRHCKAGTFEAQKLPAAN